MKKLLSISVLLLLCLCCFAVPIEYKSFKIDGETLYKWVLVTKTNYNSDGKTTYYQSIYGDEHYYYYSDGLLIRENIDGDNTYYEYDSKGNNIHIKSEDEEKWFEYNNKGQKTWYKWTYLYKGEKKTNEYSYTYNDKGDVLSDGISKYQYEYNSRGLKTRQTEQGTFECEYKYEYDAKDQLVKQTYKSKYSSFSIEYEYDSAGNLTLKKSSDGDLYEYSYNSSGDIIHSRHIAGNIIDSEYWCEYTYYNNGKIKEKTTYTHFLN